MELLLVIINLPTTDASFDFFVCLISWRFAQIQPPDGDCDLYMCFPT